MRQSRAIDAGDEHGHSFDEARVDTNKPNLVGKVAPSPPSGVALLSERRRLHNLQRCGVPGHVAKHTAMR